MAFDFSNVSVTITGTTAAVNKIAFGLTVLATGTQTVVRDFTGANAIVFPDVLTTFTNAEKLEIAQDIAASMIKIKRRAFE